MNAFYRLINWYFSRKSLPYWIILILDCLIVYCSGIFMYYLANRGYQTLINFWPVTHTLLIYVFVSVLCFRMFSTYSGVIRFSSFVDLKRVGMANGLALLISLVLHYTLPQPPISGFAYFNPRAIVGMFVIATAIMWAVRILVKVVFEVSSRDEKAMRCLIYGAQSGGIGLAKNIRTQKPARFLLKGFLSHDMSLKHNSLLGERVYTSADNIAEVLEKEEIKALLVSPLRTKDFQREQELQDILLSHGVKIYMSQNAQEWTADSDFSKAQLSEVSVEDLLPREEIQVDLDAVEKMLKGRRVLITGSAGSIGSEMVRQVAQFKPQAMMLIDQAETPQHDVRLMMARDYPDIVAHTVVTSICHEQRMEKIFSEFRPEYVFHAAAYKHVPMMEDNPSEAVLNNIFGTKVIADLAVKYGVKKFVMISTDKAVNPTNVMGCSKRICEIYVQSLNKAIQNNELTQTQNNELSELNESGNENSINSRNSVSKDKTQFVTTRFGNVLGSNGSVIPLFREQLKKGGPLTVTHPDIIRYFMLIPEACKLVLEAGTMGNGGEIFVFDMGKPVKIADLARRMIMLSGAEGVEVKFTGLRDGEKLYEEVLNEAEQTKPTFNKKIKIASVREYSYNEANREVDELIAQAKQYDNMKTVAMMKAMVPEYKSQHSVYEQLDKANN